MNELTSCGSRKWILSHEYDAISISFLTDNVNEENNVNETWGNY